MSNLPPKEEIAFSFSEEILYTSTRSANLFQMSFRAASLVSAAASVYSEGRMCMAAILKVSDCSLLFQTKDCNVVASKLMFLLDDLLWVLTDSQLKAMMKYAESLSEAMEKSAQQRKSLAPESVQASELRVGCWSARKEEKTR